MIEALFQKLSNELILQINQWPIDYECLVYKKMKIDPTNNSMEDSQYESNYFRLQLRKNYVLQLWPQKKQIISGFDCDITTTFKLCRANTVDSQEVGQLTGIQFRSERFKKKNIFMYVPQQDKVIHTQNIEKFGQLLGRKYILQDGFHQLYRAVKKIGKGVTASVYKALRLTDRQQVAVKSFKKDIYYNIDNGRGKAAFQKEFKAMTEIDCKYICRLISVYESDNSIYIVMQLLTRSLYSHLKINGFPPLNVSKQIMVKLLIGLGQLHKKNIMHRDLKLENIMVLEKESLIQPIIIDLGLAQLSTNSQFLYIKCGTPGYVAPQILSLKPNEIPSPPYNHLCDIFSMGVIFYILLVGKTVFQGNDQRQVVRKNRQCEIDYQFTNQKKLTQEMKDILRKMLQKDPKSRYTVEQLLNHQFFRQIEILKQFRTNSSSVIVQEIEEKEKFSN